MGNEGLEKISVKIPRSAITTLALEAHDRNETLNDYIVGLAVKRANEVIAEHNASADIVDLEASRG